jgi:hypothetical protein
MIADFMIAGPIIASDTATATAAAIFFALHNMGQQSGTAERRPVVFAALNQRKPRWRACGIITN